jgi:hypothetical protein
MRTGRRQRLPYEGVTFRIVAQIPCYLVFRLSGRLFTLHTTVHDYLASKDLIFYFEAIIFSTFSASLPSNTYLFLHGSGTNVFQHSNPEHVRLFMAPVHDFSILLAFYGQMA